MREAVEVMAWALYLLDPEDLDAWVDWDGIADESKAPFIRNAEFVVEALNAAGFAVVPRVSSTTMDVAGALYVREFPSDVSGCYEAMLAAAQVEVAGHE